MSFSSDAAATVAGAGQRPLVGRSATQVLLSELVTTVDAGSLGVETSAAITTEHGAQQEPKGRRIAVRTISHWHGGSLPLLRVQN